MKERIITGIILGLIVLWAIFRVGDTVFNTAVALILLLSAWEWTALANVKTLPAKIFYLVLTLLLIYISHYQPLVTLSVSFAFWIFAFYLIMHYPNIRFKAMSNSARYIMGFLVIVPLWVSVALLHHQRPSLLLLIMLVVTLADSGAYFIGRQYGKKKLVPVIRYS